MVAVVVLAGEVLTKPVRVASGLEGTISQQGVRAFGLHQARYRGLERTHLQGLATAVPINVSRVTSWLIGVPLPPLDAPG